MKSRLPFDILIGCRVVVTRDGYTFSRDHVTVDPTPSRSYNPGPDTCFIQARILVMMLFIKPICPENYHFRIRQILQFAGSMLKVMVPILLSCVSSIAVSRWFSATT